MTTTLEQAARALEADYEGQVYDDGPIPFRFLHQARIVIQALIDNADLDLCLSTGGDDLDKMEAALEKAKTSPDGILEVFESQLSIFKAMLSTVLVESER